MIQKNKTTQLVTMAMLVAISIILVAIVHIPIIPAVPFLTYDPADVPIFIGTFAFGPGWGFLITAVVSIIQGFTVNASEGIVGILMHILATGSFVLVAGFFYKRKKTRKTALCSLLFGTVTMVGIMVLWNLIITPFFLGVPMHVVVELLPWILLFNIIKAGGNSIITFFLYKPIHHLIEKFEK